MHSRVVEHIFTIASLIFYTGGPLTLILSGGASEGLQTSLPDYALVRNCFQLIYIITLLYLAPHWKRAIHLLIRDKVIILLITLIFLSSIWSVDLEKTLVRSIATFGTTLFGIYFSTRYSIKQQLHILGWVFGLAIFLNVFFAIVLPQYGIMQGIHTGAWRGIYTHKNGLGAMMALSTIIFIILAVSNKTNASLFYGGIVSSIILLLLSRASSPLIYLIILICIYFIINFLFANKSKVKYQLKALFVSLIIVFSGALIIWSIIASEAIANIFGKDLTFTGRTALWSFVWELVQKRPWLGYGYEALWSSHNSETESIWLALAWEAPNSHNAFLEVLLGLGFLGFFLLAVHILINFLKGITLIYQTGRLDYFLVVMLIPLILFSGLTEAYFISRNSIYWVLYVSTTLSLQQNSNTVSETE
jgi:O-antigen ligase